MPAAELHPPGTAETLVDLGDDNTSFVVDASTGGGAVVHWGAPLVDADLATTAAALTMPPVIGSLDVVAPVALVPEHGSGFPGRPGLSGRRADGRAWSPRFVAEAVTAGEGSLAVESVDAIAALRLVTRVARQRGGAIRIDAELVNDGSDDYWLDDLAITLALPPHVAELLTFYGRWCRELHPRRRLLDDGPFLAENRRGRTSHETPPLLFAGTAGYGEQRGEVWAAHLAWSGNSRVHAARLPDGRALIQLGELLHPGEIVLAPSGNYRSPPVFAVHSTGGLGAASRQFHAVVRASPAHRDRPRPVVLNTWEAVYFDHDFDTLARLAERAAAVGVERFVLDDGWFGGRRDDGSGLGDWWVSPEAHPDGLAPLIERVRKLGMEFGIWVEPEMVNPDSELYRAHPDWALADADYEPVLGRNQLVLDLAIPAAFDEILSRLDALLGDHDIAFVKWDMNRDHVQASGAHGRAGTHEQTLALYRLLDELRRRHPDVEFESCSSGGARIDLGILQRTERVWTSDCNDALERQAIQRHASMLIPPEVIGAHIGPPTAHTTGRTHTLAFRAATALFGHLGIEWNLLTLDADELAELAAWVELYKRHRELLHGSDTVRVDHDDPHAHVHGVLAADRRRALIAYVQLATSQALLPRPVRIAELDPDIVYRVELLSMPGERAGRWLTRDSVPVESGVELTGRQLAAHGVRLPVVNPESVVLLSIEAL
jgi:alpha-galactosidase